jgi:signal transduction histidine kinase
MSTIPTKEDFAIEVRAGRLGILWKVTLVGCGAIAMIALLFSAMNRSWDTLPLYGAVTVLAAGCWLTQSLLKHNRFEWAVWAYAMGGLAAVVLLMAVGARAVLEIAPFAFPVIIFVIGLMLPPASSFAMVIISTIAVMGITLWRLNTVEAHQIFAIALMFMSAVFSAQVTGELYQIADWALQNYQKERRTNDELFEKRQELQRSLKRSEALSEKLQITNAELETARAAAEEAKHFRGQFLANMSHELRTPLNAIIGFSETMLRFPMMYDDVQLPDIYTTDLNQIYDSGRQLLTVINDVLDLAKVDAGKLEVTPQKVEPEAVVNATISIAQGLIGAKPINLRKEVPQPIPAIWADEARVRQILLNLYSNAVKFTESGAITLRVQETEAELRFSVIDTGCGIASHNLETIFEEFKQVSGVKRDPRAGAGLGLAISRQLVTLMGGRIWVESELGKGSAFHIVLPLYKEQDKTRPRPSVLGETPDKQKQIADQIAAQPAIREQTKVEQSAAQSASA